MTPRGTGTTEVVGRVPRPAWAALARAAMTRGSASFTLASRLLPGDVRDDAAVLYAWCRRVDDAVDETHAHALRGRIAELRADLDAIYSLAPLRDPISAAFQEVARRRRIPRRYPSELLDGMEMDAMDTRYRELSDLLVYCYRVAGTVGLMMCHVMGVSTETAAPALKNAADLGMAMQLTNVCRDVAEDWERGRLYLPDAMLERAGARALQRSLGGALPAEARPAMKRVTRELLAHADDYYRSGDAGLRALPWRCSLGVRAARLVYSDIGRRIARSDYDPLAGRAIVPRRRKVELVLRAALEAALDVPRRSREALSPAAE